MKQIEKYMLPKQTNDLYKNEAISSISLSKEVASKINELVECYNELIKIDNKRELENDGRIRKAILYMKDNLLSTINELLTTIKDNGELVHIITDVVVNGISELKEIVYPIGHVKRYGATGDGKTDDTLAFMEAINDAIVNQTSLQADDGVYVISKDLDARYIKDIRILGEIKTSNTITIGNSSTDGSGMYVRIRKAPYIKVVGVKNSIFDIDYCELLHLFADGDDVTSASTAYNQFYGAYAKEILIDSVGTEIGWINENVFRIKRVEKLTMDGNYSHNNNHFEHINFEKGELNLLNARNNYISARGEGNITINSTDKSQVNFIEREYFYEHYFGDDVIEEDNGTVKYYPVNKLQSERMLYQIDENNKNFPIGSLIFNENGRFTGKSFNKIFQTNLIKIDKTFAFKLKASAKAFRVQMKFYDENKNKIITEVDNFSDGRMVYLGETSDFTYGMSVNNDNDTINFYPGYAKYVEINVIFGNAIENVEVEYLMLKLLKYTNTDVVISNKLKNNVYTSLPTDGYWEKGKILYAASPTPGTSIGVICVESGVPGVWKNFGSIAS